MRIPTESIRCFQNYSTTNSYGIGPDFGFFRTGSLVSRKIAIDAGFSFSNSSWMLC